MGKNVQQIDLLQANYKLAHKLNKNATYARPSIVYKTPKFRGKNVQQIETRLRSDLNQESLISSIKPSITSYAEPNRRVPAATHRAQCAQEGHPPPPTSKTIQPVRKFLPQYSTSRSTSSSYPTPLTITLVLESIP